VLFIPKVSWTERSSPAAVTYGAVVGTSNTIILLPRSGAESAGFTLTLRRMKDGVNVDDIAQFLASPDRPLAEIEATLIESLPDWQTRCVFPLRELTRLEVFGGWKLWLGVSAALRVGNESPMALRIPNKKHLGEMREMYRDAQVS